MRSIAPTAFGVPDRRKLALVSVAKWLDWLARELLDLDRCVLERARRGQPAEAPANDDDPWTAVFHRNRHGTPLARCKTRTRYRPHPLRAEHRARSLSYNSS